MNSFETNFERRPLWTSIKWGVGILLVVFVLGGVGTAFGLISLPFRTAIGVAERTFQPDNAIHNYEWFRDQYQTWVSYEVRINNTQYSIDTMSSQLPADRSSWAFEDRNEMNRLGSLLLGLKNARNDLAAQYNANASKANRSIFMLDGGTLPETLPYTN